MPQKMWTNWRKAYNPDLDNVTDRWPATVPTRPASLRPRTWSTTTGQHCILAGPGDGRSHGRLCRRELLASIRRRRFVGNLRDFIRIPLGLDCAAVVQPKHVPGARFWKFADGSVLSDGAASPLRQLARVHSGRGVRAQHSK